MKKHLFLIIFGLCLGFFASLGLDRVLGIVLNSTGYFMAMTPNLNELHDMSEYTITAKISSQGIRNKEVTLPKPANTYRILALGDSFTFGEGVNQDEAWPQMLEKELNGLEKEKKIEVVNAGKPGASPTDIRQICRAYVDRFGIDSIVYAMFADDLNQAAAKQQESDTFLFKIESIWPTLSRLNMKTIGFTRYIDKPDPGDTVRMSTDNRKKVENLLHRDPSVLIHMQSEFRKDFIEGKINPAVIINAVRTPELPVVLLNEDLRNYMLYSLDERLRLFSERCSRNLPVAVVFIPSSEMISEAYMKDKEGLGFKVRPELTKISLDTDLAEIMKKYSFHFVSALSSFRQDACLDCYYAYDGHLTPLGQKRLLAVLLPFVREQLLK